MNSCAGERMLQLLADQATEGLDTAAARELSRIREDHSYGDADALERAAAVADLAMSPPVGETMPKALRDRILIDASRFLRLAALRGPATFIEESADLVRARLEGDQAGFEEVSGEVVWSDATQKGFMRLVGLPPNDPSTAQYQLWIVDPDRDEHPVDGGVFDVQTLGEVFVPFEARIRVHAPTAFAITREKPGGVVVSGGPPLVVGSVSG